MVHCLFGKVLASFERNTEISKNKKKEILENDFLPVDLMQSML